jgi:histidinol-phosphate aminotransferase
MTIRPRKSLTNPDLKRPSALASVPRDPALLWLDKNENLDPLLMKVSREVLMEVPPEALATYPEAGAVYRSLAAWIGVSPDSLMLTPGSDGAIRLTFEAFVEHGDPVVHTSPTFAMYPVYSQMFGANVRTVEYRPSQAGPYLDVDELVRVIREHKPKLVCLPDPDSPTGTTLPPETLRAILTLCEEVGALFLIDEAYHPFYPWSAAEWTQTSKHLIIARTFAKAWGAAGLRIGYAIAHLDTIALLHKMRPMYEVSTIAVEYVQRLLNHRADMEATVARILDGKARFVDAMRALGFRVLPTSGNFVHVAFGDRAKAVHAALAPRVLYRANFDHPSLAGFSRFSAAPDEIMSQVTRLIRGAVESQS